MHVNEHTWVVKWEAWCVLSVQRLVWCDVQRVVVQKKHVVGRRGRAPTTKEHLADGLHRAAAGSRCEQDDLEAANKYIVEAGVVGVHW